MPPNTCIPNLTTNHPLSPCIYLTIMSQVPVNPLDHIAIQNVISRYCDALDTKDWALLNDVFVVDVDADYPFNRDLKGAEAVSKAIQGR